MDTSHLSLDHVAGFLRSGYYSREQAVAFIREWNAGPHFTQAVVTDKSIRVFDPEECELWKNLYEECGVKE